MVVGVYSRETRNLVVHYHQRRNNLLSVQAGYDFFWDSAVVGNFSLLIAKLQVG